MREGAPPVFDFVPDRLGSVSSLFPEEIDQEPWIFYHATSSAVEPAVETVGLRWTPRLYTLTDVEAVVQVFRSMNWAGERTGGYAVLHSFSLQGDFCGAERKPIYFREYSTRSLIYATRDFAGGETARALRHAFRDLNQYLNEPGLRQQHYERQRDECIRTVRCGGLPERVVRVDLEWLRQRLAELKGVRDGVEALYSGHTHGVVYAVRFTPDDLPGLSFSNSMGLRCYLDLPTERVAAKARIRAADFVPPRSAGDEEFKAHRWRYERPGTLLMALSSQGPAAAAPATGSIERLLRYQTDQFLDPRAGEDEAPAIAIEYGDVAVRNHFSRRVDRQNG